MVWEMSQLSSYAIIVSSFIQSGNWLPSILPIALLYVVSLPPTLPPNRQPPGYTWRFGTKDTTKHAEDAYGDQPTRPTFCPRGKDLNCAEVFASKLDGEKHVKEVHN
ncbi:uncharacterized protein N7500_000086 [Penicillium coprophilum]|uniref:uncharacterized protein n=1 Tax=Penicillium coprophilum TaxID=36646 RepID=UPI002397A0B5|nr:uncharacterized protein N7500_000086 [Penicillium coprophilum]KAJ5177387.1 hypothetical protein N7500_000086 [Penicillium coprophilum]